MNRLLHCLASRTDKKTRRIDGGKRAKHISLFSFLDSTGMNDRINFSLLTSASSLTPRNCSSFYTRKKRKTSWDLHSPINNVSSARVLFQGEWNFDLIFIFEIYYLLFFCFSVLSALDRGRRQQMHHQHHLRLHLHLHLRTWHRRWRWMGMPMPWWRWRLQIQPRFRLNCKPGWLLTPARSLVVVNTTNNHHQQHNPHQLHNNDGTTNSTINRRKKKFLLKK